MCAQLAVLVAQQDNVLPGNIHRDKIAGIGNDIRAPDTNPAAAKNSCIFGSRKVVGGVVNRWD
ncbi:MAG: hypothetical protein WBC93_17795 [Sulfitobacter sp.]